MPLVIEEKNKFDIHQIHHPSGELKVKMVSKSSGRDEFLSLKHGQHVKVLKAHGWDNMPMKYVQVAGSKHYHMVSAGEHGIDKLLKHSKKIN